MRGTRQGVSICGLGAVTGYGWGRKFFWDGLRSSESAVLPRPGYQEWLGHDIAYCAIVPEVERSDGLTRFGAAVSEAADEAIDNALDRAGAPARWWAWSTRSCSARSSSGRSSTSSATAG